MSTISAVLIVKNESKRLFDCLSSIKWADEIVIVDSGSEDDTLDIARQFTDKVYCHSEWPGFGKQRQLAQRYATGEWILAIDADEIVTPELAAEIKIQVALDNQNEIYLIKRVSSFFGEFLRFGSASGDWVLRLYARNKAGYNDALVHEKVVFAKGQLTTRRLNAELLHYTYDNLHHYIAKTTMYIKLWADEREGKKSVSFFTGLSHALAYFLKMYVFRLGFLDGRHGFIMAWLGMHSTFAKYTDLWLRARAKK